MGPKGQRVGSIVEELRGEKIDIVKYSEDPAQFIAAALAPADVVDVWMADEARPAACWCGRSAVPGHRQGGSECPFGARLTGYKIDIKPQSYQDSDADAAPEASSEEEEVLAEETGETPAES